MNVNPFPVYQYSSFPQTNNVNYNLRKEKEDKEEKKPTLKDSKDEIISELITNKLSSDSTLYYKTLEDIRKNANLEIVKKKKKKAYDSYMTELKNKNN